MKNDRPTYKDQYSPSGGIARCMSTGFLVEIVGRLPLARGDTDSEGIAKLLSANVIPECCYQGSYLERVIKIPAFAGMTNEHCLLADCLVESSPPLGKFIRRLSRPPSVWRFGGPPTGFSESDVGRPPGVECDVGRTLDELVSSELETTKLTDGSKCCQEFPPDRNKSVIRVRTPAQTSAGKEVPTPQEVRDGCCLTMDSTRFLLFQN